MSLIVKNALVAALKDPSNFSASVMAATKSISDDTERKYLMGYALLHDRMFKGQSCYSVAEIALTLIQGFAQIVVQMDEDDVHHAFSISATPLIIALAEVKDNIAADLVDEIIGWAKGEQPTGDLGKSIAVLDETITGQPLHRISELFTRSQIVMFDAFHAQDVDSFTQALTVCLLSTTAGAKLANQQLSAG